MKKVGGRFALLALVIVLSVVFFLPSYKPLYQALPDWARKILPDKGITLGLDLQGGIHMVMEVDEDRAVEIAVERAAVVRGGDPDAAALQSLTDRATRITLLCPVALLTCSISSARHTAACSCVIE